jgi:hypothetical protein
VEYRPLCVTQAQSIFQSSPSSPVVNDLAPAMDKSQSVKKTQYTTSAYGGFLRSAGFFEVKALEVSRMLFPSSPSPATARGFFSAS